ncbi:hypothetical protein I4641_13635 [Waterburya agarophytonicola K14]|uniref:Ubiquinone biosynthesis protein n=1 Tax=Waterburya agarophytonicola KI4 TaxID=2874699 RepID=A0A964BTL4_9CYAN|nr:Coq4 family protein [Waterburya agarophytonicola]MCC0178021.1 hypothetical protein [Waterburya agarophytonicola KI4]
MQNLTDVDQQWQEQALESFFNMVNAPDGNFEAVAYLSKTLNNPETLDIIIEFLSRNSQGRQAFLNRPRLGHVDLPQLLTLPEDTLGYVYAKQMMRNGAMPLEMSKSNNDYQFFITHLRETHDIWHVVTGFDTDIIGEIQLEAFYVAQLYASRFWLALIAKNLVKAVVDDIETAGEYLNAISQGWTMAQQAKPLFGIQWNTLWSTSLKDLRVSLNIIDS